MSLIGAETDALGASADAMVSVGATWALHTALDALRPVFEDVAARASRHLFPQPPDRALYDARGSTRALVAPGDVVVDDDDDDDDDTTHVATQLTRVRTANPEAAVRQRRGEVITQLVNAKRAAAVTGIGAASVMYVALDKLGVADALASALPTASALIKSGAAASTNSAAASVSDWFTLGRPLGMTRDERLADEARRLRDVAEFAWSARRAFEWDQAQLARIESGQLLLPGAQSTPDGAVDLPIVPMDAVDASDAADAIAAYARDMEQELYDSVDTLTRTAEVVRDVTDVALEIPRVAWNAALSTHRMFFLMRDLPMRHWPRFLVLDAIPHFYHTVLAPVPRYAWVVVATVAFRRLLSAFFAALRLRPSRRRIARRITRRGVSVDPTAAAAQPPRISDSDGARMLAGVRSAPASRDVLRALCAQAIRKNREIDHANAVRGIQELARRVIPSSSSQPPPHRVARATPPPPPWLSAHRKRAVARGLKWLAIVC